MYTNRYITYFDGDVPEGIIKNPNVKGNIKVLILKDSYANAMVQFIARSFSETRVMDLRHNKDLDIKDYIEKII
ncbi:DHHW family protein [Bacillus sp. N9]